MPETLQLFPEPELKTKSILAPRLRSLARQNIFIGTNSWKFPGWIGEIYSPHRYKSHKRFEADCLTEYAETFPVVCGDFAFYQFPSPEFWQKLFAQVPESFLFAFKAPEEITRPRFPSHARYGAKAGLANPQFLDAETFKTQFLDLLAPYAGRIPVIILEFGTVARTIYNSASEFAAALKPFLAALPSSFRFAIEIRNPEFFDDSYFDLLRHYGIAHLFNAWTHMPPLIQQLERPRSFTSNFTVIRSLLTPGRTYEAAAQTFQPFDSVKEANQPIRDTLRQVVARAKLRAEPTYIFVSNSLEGFAPGTIQAVTAE